MEKEEQEREEQLGPCKETEQAAVGKAKTWRCGKEERRRGLIKASREDLARLATKWVGREEESKEKKERLCPLGWGRGKALEGGG